MNIGYISKSQERKKSILEKKLGKKDLIMIIIFIIVFIGFYQTCDSNIEKESIMTKAQKEKKLNYYKRYIDVNLKHGFINKIDIDNNIVFVDLDRWTETSYKMKEIFIFKVTQYFILKYNVEKVLIKDFISKKKL